MRRIVASAATALFLASVVGVAHADATSDAKKACGEAYENAQVLMKKDSLRQARAQLDKCTAPACAAFIREECTKWTSEVDSGMTSIVPVFTDSSGASVTPSGFTVDGVDTPPPAAGAAIDMDPGKHILEATRGTDHATLEVTTTKGQKNVATKIVFAPAQATTDTPNDSNTGKKLPVLPIALGAVGAAAVIGSFVIGAIAKGDLSDLDKCKGHCAQKDVDSVDSKITMSTVFFIGGVVLIGAGAVLYFTTGRKKSTAIAPHHALVEF
jgi:hypothetical protein